MKPSKPIRPIVLDEYEQSIEDSKDVGKLSKKEREKIEAMLAAAKKTKHVNIRLTAHDLARIRALSADEGLPYQTFMGSILHKYVSGKLIDENAILHSIQMANGNYIPDVQKAPTKKIKTKKPA
jgi:predicted DNA binding CopG/RHH family protein